jgi:hypothetical protein
MHFVETTIIGSIFFGCFIATFSNISAISRRPVLVVEKAGVPGENHRPWGSNWYTLSHAAASRVHPFCNSQSWARKRNLVPTNKSTLDGYA